MMNTVKKKLKSRIGSEMITYRVFKESSRNLPTNVPTKKGRIGTPMTGDEILMNQLGKNGVMRKNMM